MNHYWTITTTFLLLSAYLHFLSKSFHMLCLCPLLHDYWYQQRSPWISSEACLKSKSIKFLNSVHLYVFTTSVQFPVIFLCILDDNIMFMKTKRGFFFSQAWNQEHSNIILYLLLHFLTLCCPFYQSNVSQEKQSCLKLIHCLIFMISLIILTTKIHKKIGINPSLEQTLPLYLTLALMISFPAGRGCILSIFSHSCCNHRSTTASGLSQKKKKLDSLLSYHKCTCLIGCTNWCIF